MKKFFLKITQIFLIIIFVFSSCFKQRTLKELESQQILSYISDLGLDFDTISSGVLLHKSYNGVGENFYENQKVKMIYSGYNLDEEKYFVEDDSFEFFIGDRKILEGWNQTALLFAQGGSGIVIFPYDKAYGIEQTPDIPPYSTLVYFFRFISDNYRINQNSLFWRYAEQYDSIMTIFDDSLCYVKYFEGSQQAVNQNDVAIDYSLYTLDDSLITKADSFMVDFSNSNSVQGLLEGILSMHQGEMGKILIPPSLSYTSENIYNLKPYTAIYAETRIIADDPDENQESRINKYIYTNNANPDSILSSGIYYFVDKQADEGAPSPTNGSRISYTDSIMLINHKYAVSKCEECNATLSNSNFFEGQISAIKLMKKGEEATFIIPYQKAYGSSGQGIIPPYATLVYKIKLTDVQ